MGVVKITSVYMLMGMLILISLYMKTCSIALLLVFPNLVTNFYCSCSGEPVEMKLWLQISGRLCHRCIINSNKNPMCGAHAFSARWGGGGTDLVPGR